MEVIKNPNPRHTTFVSFFFKKKKKKKKEREILPTSLSLSLNFFQGYHFLENLEILQNLENSGNCGWSGCGKVREFQFVYNFDLDQKFSENGELLKTDLFFFLII